MDIKVKPNSFFVFDLDDTLFQEIDYLKSAYLNISVKLKALIKKDIYPEMLSRYYDKENVFKWILDTYQELMPEITVEWLLKEYREHLPVIQLSTETAKFLDQLKTMGVPTGLITDGRSITQRNKLKALGIENDFKEIIISEEFGSEKPDEKNYLFFVEKYPDAEFYFFGDNTTKDFIVPCRLKWKTICMKNQGNNIHLQSLGNLPIPEYIISSFREIQIIF